MHEDHEGHDHSQPTHSANCDSCGYVAEVHAQDEEGAVSGLSQDLAAHNKAEHNMETDPETIKEPVRAKMQTL